MIDNYPPGAANDPRAPYNEPLVEGREVEVTISLTISKTVKVAVTDYEYFEGERDEDGYNPPCYDYSNCDLKAAVKEQIYLPHEVHKHMLEGTQLKKDLEGWIVDDFEVILE